MISDIRYFLAFSFTGTILVHLLISVWLCHFYIEISY